MIEETIKKITPIDKNIIKKAEEKLNSLTKPIGSLGRLEELAKKIVSITGNLTPSIKNKAIIVFVSDHGVVEEGVSAYPKEVTYQMVANFVKGGAGINVLSRHIGAKVFVVDIGVDADLSSLPIIHKKINYGTKNFTKKPAMSYDEAIKSIEVGIEVIQGIDADIVGLGDMGIGNTTPSSAIIAYYSKQPIEKVTGIGTGIDDATFNRKINAIKKAIAINKPNINDPIDVLSKIGGFEIGGIAGAILAGAAKKIPVVINGFISTAGAIIATKLCPIVKEYIIASHNSQEPGHKIMLNMMHLSPLFDLNLRLGEGTGAALAINLIEASIKILNEMATFSSAGVSEKYD